jgi:hypothetical protein
MILISVLGLFVFYTVCFLLAKKNKTLKSITFFSLTSLILGLLVQLYAFNLFSGLTETQWLIQNFIGFKPDFHQGFIGSDMFSFLKQVEWFSWMWPNTNVEMADSYLYWVFIYAVTVLAATIVIFFILKFLKTKKMDTYLYLGAFLIGPLIDILFSIIAQSYTFNFLKISYEFGEYIITHTIDIRDMFLVAFLIVFVLQALKQGLRIERIKKIRKSRV